MSNSEYSLEDEMSADFEKLENLLTNSEKLVNPESCIDKQILAAAHREMCLPKKTSTFRVTWLKKLSLPLYVASGFIFSVLALKSLWQPPIHTIQEDSNTSVAVNISIEQNAVPNVTTPKPRQKRELPEMIGLPEVVEPTSKSDVAVRLVENDESTSDAQQDENSGVYTGTEFSVAEFREKEAWVRKIIHHMKNGESEIARSELIKFKTVYPEYPIEEQIKVLN